MAVPEFYSHFTQAMNMTKPEMSEHPGMVTNPLQMLPEVTNLHQFDVYEEDITDFDS